MKVSRILKREVSPFLFGALFQRILVGQKNGKNIIYTVASFKLSKLVAEREMSIINYSEEYIKSLNYYSCIKNWEIVRVSNSLFEAHFNLENDLHLNEIQFFEKLYEKFIGLPWVHEHGLTDKKREFIRGFVELRGSVDTTATYIAQDYFYSNEIELRKARIITDLMDVPICFVNFNMRNLQPQFVEGINKRNAQFRVNSLFFANKIGFLNKYKARIFQKAFHNRGSSIIDDVVYFNVDLPVSRDDDVVFIKYLNFFSKNIYKQDLTLQMVEKLRRKIGFSSSAPSEDRRNRAVIEIYNELAPERCAICGCSRPENIATGRHFFEVHHVISRQNGPYTDHISNLVKLCPNCHTVMKKGAAPQFTQEANIKKILTEHQDIYDFCSSYLGITELNSLATKIWSLLG